MFQKQNDPLFILIKSLEKSEKRNFKLFVTRNTSGENLKTISLFDALDKMSVYNEKVLLLRAKGVSKLQLSNLKASLYRQILSSMRIIRQDAHIETQMHELMDFARILYNKGLYLQSLKQLERLKEMAINYHQASYWQQALIFEKKIETLYITRSMQSRADVLTNDTIEAEKTLSLVNRLSNLALQLYSWYLQNGHVRNKEDIKSVQLFFKVNMPPLPQNLDGFYEKLYYAQALCWKAFLQLDFLNYFKHTHNWLSLFETYPKMIEVETASYIKAFHNHTTALFYILNTGKLLEVVKKFDQFSKSPIVLYNENNKILAYQYLYTARINLYFLQGRFDKGIKMVAFLEEMLKQYEIYLDRHRVMIFYYKIACLYFGSGDYDNAILFLNRIIHQKAGLRNDLQCYARLLHLISHYELSNFELLEYLSKSVYRFMAKMENLSKVEIEIFKFLQRSFKVGAHALKPEFEMLLSQLKKLRNNPLESRAFAYLDIISWLESKIKGVDVQQIIRQKYLGEKTV